jgi:hypothetical protein
MHTMMGVAEATADAGDGGDASMPTFHGNRAVLAECADMVLRVGDPPRDVPCVKYIVLTCCGVIRYVCEDVTMDRDDRGRVVVPVPGVDPQGVELVLDILHGLRLASTLTEAEAVATLRGIDVLGCDAVAGMVLGRLWTWLRVQTVERILPHASRLMRDASVQGRVLSRLVMLRPCWSDFQADVLDKLPLDFDLAKVMLTYLIRFFPASTVLGAIVQRLQSPTADKVLALCGDHGTYYHPGEVRDVLKLLGKAIPADHAVAPLARSLTEALTTFRALPLASSRVHGTVLLFQLPTVSALMTFQSDQPTKPMTVRATSWLRVELDPRTGAIDVSFVLGRVDDNEASSSAQLRVTCWSRDKGTRESMSETWHCFENIDRQAWTSLTHETSSFGQQAAEAAAVQNLHRLRVDLFYSADQNVLDQPF